MLDLVRIVLSHQSIKPTANSLYLLLVSTIQAVPQKSSVAHGMKQKLRSRSLRTKQSQLRTSKTSAMRYSFLGILYHFSIFMLSKTFLLTSLSPSCLLFCAAVFTIPMVITIIYLLFAFHYLFKSNIRHIWTCCSYYVSWSMRKASSVSTGHRVCGKRFLVSFAS